MKKTKITLLAAAALALAGCTATGGTAFDPRTEAAIGSDELRAACAERAQKGVLFDAATYFANIATAIPGAVAGAQLARANPLTQNIDAKCHEQRVKDGIE